MIQPIAHFSSVPVCPIYQPLGIVGAGRGQEKRIEKVT